MGYKALASLAATLAIGTAQPLATENFSAPRTTIERVREYIMTNTPPITNFLNYSARRRIGKMDSNAGTHSMLLSILDKSENLYAIHINGLNPGENYVLASKTNLESKIENTWVPFLLFPADSPETEFTFYGLPGAEAEFFDFWNVSRYSGPSVSISNIKDNETLSNIAIINASVSDILPDAAVQVYVDGDYHSEIRSGSPNFEIDTRRYSNGPHDLSVLVRTKQITQDNLELESIASVTNITFNNFLTTSIGSLLPSDFGSVFIPFATTGPAEYKVTIMDEQEREVFRTYSGTTQGGNVEIGWDFLDERGNLAITPGQTCTFNIQATPRASIARSQGPRPTDVGSSNNIVIKSYLELPVKVGKEYLLRIKRNTSSAPKELIDKTLMDTVHAYNEAGELFSPEPAGTRGVYDHEVKIWSSAAQANTITNDLSKTEVSGFCYKGHAGPNGLGSGADTPFDGAITEVDFIRARRIVLNYPKGIYEATNSMRFVQIHGCNTATGDLPLSFGIPPLNLDRMNLSRRSYVGWVNTIDAQWVFNRYTDAVQRMNARWTDWETKPSIRTAIAEAIILGNYEIDPKELRLSGSRLLTWSGNPNRGVAALSVKQEINSR